MHGEYRSAAPAVGEDSAAATTNRHRSMAFIEGMDKDGLIDSNYRKIMSDLFAWMRVGVKFSQNEVVMTRRVTLLCCGWVDGFNFELSLPYQEGYKISIFCHSLLPTISKPFSSASPNLDYLRGKLQNTGIKGSEVNITEAASSPRAYSCNGNVVSLTPVLFESEATALEIFGEVQPASSTVKIVDGPRLLRITSHSALLGVDAVGQGRVVCALYEVPVHSTLADLRAIMSIPNERRAMASQRKESQSKYLYGPKRTMLFRFHGLRSYCCYCAAIATTDGDPSSQDSTGNVLLAHFRTFEIKSNPVNSFLLASLSRKHTLFYLNNNALLTLFLLLFLVVVNGSGGYPRALADSRYHRGNAGVSSSTEYLSPSR